MGQQNVPRARADGSPDLIQLVGELTEDPQGPFESIGWFCADGTINPGDQPCDSIGGIRHGVHKDRVSRIARHYGIYLGQILAGTDFEVFLDEHRFFSRAKQYQIETYLQHVDDGWIMRQARNYEGAVNNEDEIDWGKRFLVSLCADDSFLTTQFFLLRELTRSIPHRETDTVGSIHQFMGIDSLPRLLTRIPEESMVWNQLNDLVDADSMGPGFYSHISEMLWTIRSEIHQIAPDWRLAMVDLSLELEFMLTRHAAAWHPTTARGLFEQNFVLARAAAGCGYLQAWEWQSVEPYLALESGGVSMTPDEFSSHFDAARRVVDWGIEMVRVHYDPVVDLFGSFEPLTFGFLPDRLQTSVLFSLTQSVESIKLKVAASSGTEFKNSYGDSTNVTEFRGLTPGVASGRLMVSGTPDSVVSFSSESIYALPIHPITTGIPAGIITAMDSISLPAELMISQMAGTPGAIVAANELSSLDTLSGTRFYLAVSPGGQVVFKPVEEMTPEESAMIGLSPGTVLEHTVDTHDIDLSIQRPIPIDSVDAYGSDRFCGPNTGRLARLKSIFPEFTSNGLIVPFGVFRNHFDTPMPGAGGSYWDFLTETFDKAGQWRDDGELERVIDHFVLMRLSQLGESVRSMPILGNFHNDLRRVFQNTFGGSLGNVPVFVRGDVNIESTDELGATGLDLTVPNVISEAALLQAIRDVWASVFSESNYERRQRFLSDPRSLYASVLVQAAVDVEKSGVVTLTGLPAMDTDDVTVSFHRGVGGFETGRLPERYLLQHGGTDVLLSPIRESRYPVLSAAGGVEEGYSAAMTPVSNVTERLAIRYVTGVLRELLPHIEGFESSELYEVEMGFENGNIWLFQVLPFSQNQRARQLAYLYELDRVLVPADDIELDDEFPPRPVAAAPEDSTGADTAP